MFLWNENSIFWLATVFELLLSFLIILGGSVKIEIIISSSTIKLQIYFLSLVCDCIIECLQFRNYQVPAWLL